MRNPLSNEELLEMIESGLSDIEFLSDKDGDDGWHDELSEGEDIFDVGNDEEVELEFQIFVDDGIGPKKYIDVSRPEVVQNYNSAMGGVDKLDILITICRTFIRSKKWTLRMFTIDLACAKGWLEYTKNAKLLEIPKKDILDLLAFRAYVAEAQMKVDKPVMKRKGRPSSE
ncbi:hypothetical protein JTB14_001091 [Gonioctena quinquepunctata]|nr:hypothetical protein JTB14_001091 [Gonioctena quinquepunctata]